MTSGTDWWLPSVSFTIAFFCAFPAARLRRGFVLSCVLIWTLGAWLYTAFPALGPIYGFADVWQEAIPEMPHAEGSQRLLAENYQRVVAGRTGPLRQFNPTRGVAAMPSLHVGVHWLFTLWFRRHLRPLFLLALLATLLTFVGSVVTGWHYAIDGYVGIVLAQGVFWLTTRLERTVQSARPEGDEQPPDEEDDD
ncbi:MAG: phosphatase PAP2 family protein [Thermoanaerobaculia bacterium]